MASYDSREASVAVDVAVVGAGVIGACVARAVRQRGFEVALIDPAPGEGASQGNAGLVVPSYCIPMSTAANLRAGFRGLFDPSRAISVRRPLSGATAGWLARFAWSARPAHVRRTARATFQLAIRSRALYDEWQAGGLDLGLEAPGWLWAYRSASGRRTAEAVVRELERAGSGGQLLTAGQARDLEPGLSDDVTAALWFPDEAVLDPARATQVLLDDAEARGVRIVRDTVVAADRDGRRVRALRTPTQTITARWFVLAAGAASRRVGALMGTRLAVEAGHGWSITIPVGDRPIRRALMNADDHAVLSPLPGAVRVTGGLALGGGPTRSSSAETIARLQVAAARLVPALAELPGGTAWFGARPMSAGGLPVLGRCASADNLFAATGHGTLGMTLAPVSGEIVADAIAGTL